MRRLVLVGAGHAHARVLLEFAQRRPSGVDVVLVTPLARAPYSGMVPGWLAGHYAWDECNIDFRQLCERAGVRLHMHQARGIDLEARMLLLDDDSRLPYNWLSLDIGSTLVPPGGASDFVLSMRPLATLRERWENLLERVIVLEPGARFRVAMLGGGAAGVESVLAAAVRLRALAPAVRFAFTLATRDRALVTGLAPAAGRLLARQLAARRVSLITGFKAHAITPAGVCGEDGRMLEADAFLWATGAQPWRWPADAGLATDDRGFIRIDATLRSVSHPEVFASGDCASFDPPLPKAGVYAVRMGPVLAHNLRAAIDERPLCDYRPQRRFLVLIGTGDRHAVAAWGSFAWHGAWAWRWKERIDRGFIARHAQVSPA